MLHYSHSVVVSFVSLYYFWVFISLIIFKHSNSWDPGTCNQRLVIIQWKVEMIPLTAGDLCIIRAQQGNLNFPPSDNNTILVEFSLGFCHCWISEPKKDGTHLRCFCLTSWRLHPPAPDPLDKCWPDSNHLTLGCPQSSKALLYVTADRFDQHHGRLKRMEVMRWKSNEGKDGAAMPAQHRVPIRRHRDCGCVVSQPHVPH